jgi:hypothetical protein
MLKFRVPLGADIKRHSRQGEATMTATLDIDELVRGVSSGNYLNQPGSQFGSVWEIDGLMAAQATPEQYAAFAAPPGVKLGRGVAIDWLTRKWTTMLAYRREQLVQVTIQGEPTEAAFVEVSRRISPLLGDGRQIELAQDASQHVLCRLEWAGKDGTVTAVRTVKYVRVSIERYHEFRRGFRRAVAWLSDQLAD